MRCYVKEDALAYDLISVWADRMVESWEGSHVLIFLMLLTLRAPVFFKEHSYYFTQCWHCQLAWGTALSNIRQKLILQNAQATGKGQRISYKHIGQVLKEPAILGWDWEVGEWNWKWVKNSRLSGRCIKCRLLYFHPLNEGCRALLWKWPWAYCWDAATTARTEAATGCAVAYVLVGDAGYQCEARLAIEL